MSSGDLIMAAATIVTSALAIFTIVWHAGVMKGQFAALNETVKEQIRVVAGRVDKIETKVDSLSRDVGYIKGHLNMPAQHE